MEKSFSAESPTDAAAAQVTLRPALPGDEQFLLVLYASTRADELAQLPWGRDQLQAFLRMQLNARDQAYRMYYPDLEDRIILVGSRPAGRLLVVRGDEEIRLTDIALLPEHRGGGVGTSLIRGLMAEARETKRPLRLQVEKSNAQARRLYERLGFAFTGENDTHFQAIYPPPESVAASGDTQ